MNLICNNCIGAQIYSYRNEKYSNPFIWNWINIEDFCKLLMTYDSLDFLKFNSYLEKRNNKYNSIVYFDNVFIHFIHYILNENNDKVSINNNDVEYKDILEYTNKKWIERSKRINETPVFLYSFNFSNISGEEKEFNKLIKLNPKYKLIIIIHKSLNLKYENISNNIHIIELNDEIIKLDRIKFTEYLMKNTNINDLIDE